MPSFFRRIYTEAMFRPNITSTLVNPFYFSRRGLFRGIHSQSKNITGKILDFGCGKKPYRDLFDSQEYIGLDIEASGHSHALSQVDVFYNGKNIPFDASYFDSVFSSEVFEHVSDLEAILLELHRVLKPSGHMLITMPFIWDEHEIPFDFTRFTSFGIVKVLEKCGFQIVSQKKTTNYIETIFQMWNAYVYQHILPKNRVIKLILTPILIAPVTFSGLILSAILPKNYGFFLNNVILCRKPHTLK